jgi:membrane protein YdbS with pleckstrin-like domain
VILALTAALAAAGFFVTFAFNGTAAVVTSALLFLAIWSILVIKALADYRRWRQVKRQAAVRDAARPRSEYRGGEYLP